MSNEITNDPEIRFDGYAGDWEQCKFSDYYKIASGYAFKMSDYTVKGIPIINGESIQHGEISTKNINYLSQNFKDDYSQFLLKSNDIVLGLNRPITNGSLKISTVPDELDGSLLYQRAGKVVYEDEIDSSFTYTLLSNEIMKHTIKEAVGSDQPFISTSKLAKWKMLIPNNQEEQMKIGTFFKELDDTIALHQRELDLLEQTKQTYLQKMFPKTDEDKPEIRFAGFTDIWEQRKLSEVSKMYNNLRIPVTASDRTTGSTPYYGANGIQDYIEGFTHSGEYVLIAEDGANDLLNYPVHYVNGTVWVNNHAHVISGKNAQLHNLFLVSRIKAMNIIPWLVGGGRAKLNGEVLKKLPILIPSYEEQQKIGIFFKSLDDTIALHQRELDSLKEIKKTLLQKMFV